MLSNKNLNKRGKDHRSVVAPNFLKEVRLSWSVVYGKTVANSSMEPLQVSRVHKPILSVGACSRNLGILDTGGCS